MLLLSPSLKPLSSYHYTFPNPIHQNPKGKSLNFIPNKATSSNYQYQTEREIEFDVGDTFFRRESATARDLGVLSAAIYKQSNGNLRVLDAMCGCGIRSLRYLLEAEADFVLANDANDHSIEVVLRNLGRVSSGEGEERRWTVKHSDANRVMTECYVKRDYFDLVDVDSFGSDSSFLRSALLAVKLDGLLYLTSTDGLSSGGHRPHHSLGAYGAFIRRMPYANEIGLRMLIGGAVREASVLGFHVDPLFSYYSYHGPVFRVMLRVKQGKLADSRHYGFVTYCEQCGNSQEVLWNDLGQISCHCDSTVPGSLIVSGPLWTGPLHSASHVTRMLNLAEQWGWTCNDTGKRLKKLLTQMIEESDPRLPFGYIKLDEVTSRGKLNSPPLYAIISALKKEGFAVSRSHISPKAIKTNCSTGECIRIFKELQNH